MAVAVSEPGATTPSTRRRLVRQFFSPWTLVALAAAAGVVAGGLACYPMLYQKYATPASQGGVVIRDFWLFFWPWMVAVAVGTALVALVQLRSTSSDIQRVGNRVVEETGKLKTEVANANGQLTTLTDTAASSLTQLGTITTTVNDLARALPDVAQRVHTEVEAIDGKVNTMVLRFNDVVTKTETLRQQTSDALATVQLSTLIRSVDQRVNRTLSVPFDHNGASVSLRGSPHFVYLVRDRDGNVSPFYLESHALIASGRVRRSENAALLELFRLEEAARDGEALAWNAEGFDARRLPGELVDLGEGVTIPVTTRTARVGVLVVARWKENRLFFQPDGGTTDCFGEATDCVANAADDIAELLADARAWIGGEGP